MLGGKAYAYNIGESKELVPKVSGSVINFGSMRESSGSVYHDYKYRDISDGKLILINVNNKTLWRSVDTRFVIRYTESDCSNGYCEPVHASTIRLFSEVPDDLSYYINLYIQPVQPIPFEFIGYENRVSNVHYKSNQTISLKFNEKSLEQFSSTLSSLTAGISIPIKIHKKHVGRLIVKKTSNNILYLEKDSSDSTNIVDIVLNNKSGYVEQEISVVTLINNRDYLTHLGGKGSISKTLVTN